MNKKGLSDDLDNPFFSRKKTCIPYKTVITYKYSHNNTINEGQG